MAQQFLTAPANAINIITTNTGYVHHTYYYSVDPIVCYYICNYSKIHYFKTVYN